MRCGRGRLPLLLRQRRHAVCTDGGARLEGGRAGGRGPQPARPRPPHVHRRAAPGHAGRCSRGRHRPRAQGAGRTAAAVERHPPRSGGRVPRAPGTARSLCAGTAARHWRGGRGADRCAPAARRPGAGAVPGRAALCRHGRAVRQPRAAGRDAGPAALRAPGSIQHTVHSQRGARSAPGGTPRGGAQQRAVLRHAHTASVLPRPAGSAARDGLGGCGIALSQRAAGGAHGGAPVHPLCRPGAVAGPHRPPDGRAVCAPAGQLSLLCQQL